MKILTVEYFNNFIEEIPQPICLIKVCNKVLYFWNDAFKDLTGYHESELKGKPWSLVFSFDKHEHWKPLISTMKKKGNVNNIRGEIMNTTGKKIPVLISIKIVHMEDEDLFLVSVSDISTSVTRDQRSRKKIINDQRLRFHFENTPLAIIEWDTDFIVTKWSRKAEKLFGWKSMETIGKPISDLNIIYSEDIHLVEKTMTILREEGTVVSSNRNVTKNGEIIHCVWYNSVLKDENGKMISVMSLVDNISDRKKAEEQLQQYSEKLEKLFEARTAELIMTNSKLQEEIVTRTLAESTLREQKNELNDFKENLEEIVRERTSELESNNRKLTSEIVARMRAVEALKESERKYREIVQNIPGMVFQLKVQRDGSNKFTYISPRASDLFDLPAEEISTKWEFTNHIHPDDRGHFISSIGNAVSNHAEWNFEGRILTLNNDIKWFQGVSSPALVGQELVMDGIMLDITEKKLTEQALYESEYHFRSLFTSMNEGFLVSELFFNKDGKPVDYMIITVNPSFEKQTGIPCEEAIGRRATQVFPGIEQIWLDTYGRVVQTGIPEHFESYNAFTNKYYSAYVYRVYNHHFAMIFYDLTEQKNSREKMQEAEEVEMSYNMLFNYMTDGVQICRMIFDEKGKAVDWEYLAVNPAWHNQTGISSDVVGRKVSEIVPNLEKEWLEVYGRVVKSGIPESFENFSVFTNRLYFFYCYKLKDNQCVVVLQDVTRKREIQKELETSEKRYRSLFDSISEGFEIMEVIFDEKNDPVNLKYLSVNPAWHEQTGISDNVNGKLVTEVFPRIDDNFWIEQYGKIALTGEPERFENFNEFSQKIFSAYIFRIEGNICASILTDVTTVRKEEKELQINLTKYKVLFDTFPLGITVSDNSGKIIEINHKAEEILEMSQDEVYTRTIVDKKWNIIKVDGSLLPAEEFASAKALRDGVIVLNQEMGLVSEKGNVRWIDVSAAPIPLDGYGVAITYQDITEKIRNKENLEESERSFQTLFNAMSEGFAIHEIIIDRQGNPVDYRFLNVNPAFENITGLKRENIQGKTVKEVLGNIEPEWIARYGEVALTGKSAQFENYSHALKKYYHVFAYSPVHGQFAVIFMDITNLKIDTGKIKKT